MLCKLTSESAVAAAAAAAVPPLSGPMALPTVLFVL